MKRSPWSRERGKPERYDGAGIRGAGAAFRVSAFFARVRSAFSLRTTPPVPRDLRMPRRRHPDEVVAFRDRRPASWRALAFDRPDLAEARGIRIVRERLR